MMLSTTLSTKKLSSNSANTTPNRMATPKATPKHTMGDRDRITILTHLSEEAHIRRNINEVAYEKTAAEAKKPLSIRPAFSNATRIAASIFIATNNTWRKAQQEIGHGDTDLDKTDTSDSTRDESSPEPYSGDETDRTSIYESDNEYNINELTVALKQKEAENAPSRLSKASTKKRLPEKTPRSRRVTTERDDVVRKANLEKRKILNTSRTRTDALKAEIEALETKHEQYVADHADAMVANHDTITSLVARLQQKEKEYQTVSQMLLQKFPTGLLLQYVIKSNEAGKKETNDLRCAVRQLKEQNENLLDTLQNTVNDCTRHREAELTARSAENSARDTISDLEDKVSLLKMQVRDVVKQRETRGGIPAGEHCTALDIVEQMNEELRNLLQAERQQRTEIQAKLDKLDNENLSLSVDYDAISAQLVEQKEATSTLKSSKESMTRELRILQNVARSQQGVMLEGDKQDLLDLVKEKTQENQGLIEEIANIKKMWEETREWSKTIEDKCDTEVRKAIDNASYWWNLYYDEAVPTTERLHAEIAELKAEKGERHFVESARPANPEVYDRKFLPYMARDQASLEGVPAHLIPSAVYHPKFRAMVSPTVDALATLRPLGWRPVWTSGKVWLSKVVEPLSEEEALRRIEGDSPSAGSGQSSISLTYAPRNAPAIPATRNDIESPSRPKLCAANLATKSRIPFPMGLSKGRIYCPAISGRGQQPAAGRTVATGSLLSTRPMRQNSKQAVASPSAAQVDMKATPQPRAARRVAQTPVFASAHVPAYRSSWAQRCTDLTREVYNDMDSTLKLDVLEMLGVDRC